ncbi:hypothetical protein HY995_03130 [Candidatus Micrarchaeota archaeon]|nr:hypothetical protein [Candidatus Micrarchaeota archaeon]
MATQLRALTESAQAANSAGAQNNSVKFSGAFFLLKPHLFASIALFTLLTDMALEGRREVRVLLLAPAVILFFAALISYGLEYDAFARMNIGRRRAEAIPSVPAAGAIPESNPPICQVPPTRSKLTTPELEYLLRK